MRRRLRRRRFEQTTHSHSRRMLYSASGLVGTCGYFGFFGRFGARIFAHTTYDVRENDGNQRTCRTRSTGPQPTGESVQPSSTHVEQRLRCSDVSAVSTNDRHIANCRHTLKHENAQPRRGKVAIAFCDVTRWCSVGPNNKKTHTHAHSTHNAQLLPDRYERYDACGFDAIVLDCLL